jgi:hypothetical protein
MRLLRLSVAAAAALVLTASASATHDPNHFYSGNWSTEGEIPFKPTRFSGTIKFTAVTPAAGEAAIQAMGISISTRKQYCNARTPGQYYVGSYDGGIGEGYEAGGVQAERTGTHAGCIDNFSNLYEGYFKNNISLGQIELRPESGTFSGIWGYGSDFIGSSYKFNGTFAGHFPGDGAEDNPDTDGDGLPDKWETRGYDAGDDGTVDVALPQMGADPLHKDVFVQLDTMVGHQLQRSAIAKVVTAFAKAPVSNPDGKPGITLHVDMGADTVMNPSGAKWGALSHSGTTPHQEVLGSGSEKNYNWDEFDAVKKKNFPAARAPIFRYALSIHRYGSKSQDSGGLGRLAGADFLIAMGAYCEGAVDCQGTEEEQSGTFMHELGHTLGLRHGGDTNTNYKPNYFSIMNYAYQISGLTTGGAPFLDYSRFRREGAGAAGQVMPSIDELDLDEGRGFGPLALSTPPYDSLFDCGSVKKTESIRGPIDWNCNGNIDTGRLGSDLNDDGKYEVLTSFDDWSNLVFKGGPIGSPGAPAPPRQTAIDEAPASELIAAAGVMLGDTKAPTVQVKGKRRIRGKRGRLTVTAVDQKQVAALSISDGRKWFQFFAKPNVKRISILVRLTRPGVYHLAVSGVDRVGNNSKRKRITAVVGRGARRAAGSPARALFQPVPGGRAAD